MKWPIVLFLLGSLSGCGLLAEKETPDDPYMKLAKDVSSKPIPPERSEQLLDQVGDDFVYGPGLGEAVVNVGATVVFPPYGLYILGNAILDYAGYEQLRVTNMLDKEDKDAWNEVYDGVVSGPGRASAAIAGREYRTKERISDDSNKLLTEIAADQKKAEGDNTEGIEQKESTP